MNEIHLFIAPVLGAVMISAMMGTIGVFIIWRRMVWVSIALSQIAGLGVTVGHVLGLNPVFCALVSSYAGAFTINISYNNKVLHKDNINAILYIVSSVVTLLILAVNPSSEWGAEQLFNGDLLYLTYSDIAVTLSAFVIFMTVLFSCRLPWIRLIVYEQEGMETNRPHNILFFIILAGSIAVCSHQAGLLFCFGSMLFPALCVNILRINSRYSLICAGLFSVVSALTGIFFALRYNLPFGLSIVLCMFVFFLASVLVKGFCLKNQ